MYLFRFQAAENVSKSWINSWTLIACLRVWGMRWDPRSTRFLGKIICCNCIFFRLMTDIHSNRQNTRNTSVAIFHFRCCLMLTQESWKSIFGFRFVLLTGVGQESQNLLIQKHPNERKLESFRAALITITGAGYQRRAFFSSFFFLKKDSRAQQIFEINEWLLTQRTATYEALHTRRRRRVLLSPPKTYESKTRMKNGAATSSRSVVRPPSRFFPSLYRAGASSIL